MTSTTATMLHTPLAGKVAVITGADQGVGLGIAQEFIDQGASVVITGRRQAELDSAVTELGPRSSAVRADVSVQSQMEQMYETVIDRHGRLDVAPPAPRRDDRGMANPAIRSEAVWLRAVPQELTPPLLSGCAGPQGREPEPVARLVADPADLTAQHGVLVPEYQELGVLGQLAPGQHRQATQQTTGGQVDDRNDHSAMIPAHQPAQTRFNNRAPQVPAVTLRYFAAVPAPHDFDLFI
jgi:hypothetical protein